MPSDDILRTQLLTLLKDGQAHAELDDAVQGVPVSAMNKRVRQVPYTLWGLLEHIRRTQHDIVEFILDPDYESPEWPAGYWPDRQERATAAAWKQSIEGFHTDRRRLVTLVRNQKTKLTADILHAPGYTILREVLLAVDHTAYHVGEVILLRRLLGNWNHS